MWMFSMSFNIKNLFTKSLARKHLNLLDPFLSYMVIGNAKAHNYLYYAN